MARITQLSDLNFFIRAIRAIRGKKDLTNVSAADISNNMIVSLKPEERLPLTPAVFHILLALTDGERHGYAIMRDVAESTNDQINMGPGTLYGTIKRLLEAGLIEESDQRPDSEDDDERRRYYRLTGVGERVVDAEAQRYEEMAKLVRRKRLAGKLPKFAAAEGM